MNHHVDYQLSYIVASVLFLVGMLSASYYAAKGCRGAVLIFAAGFLLRVLAVFTIYGYLVDIGGDGFVIQDDRKYDYISRDVANDLDGGLNGYIKYDIGIVNIGYFNFGGFLYHNFEFDTLTMRIVNAFLSAITAILIYSIVKNVIGSREGKLAACIYALLPSVIFWSAQQLKDSVVLFLMAIIIQTLFVTMKNVKGKLLGLIIMAFAIIALWFVRKDICFPLVAVISVSLFIQFTPIGLLLNKRKISAVVKIFGIVIFLGVGLLATFYTEQGADFVDSLSGVGAYQKQLVESDQFNSGGFTNKLRVIDIGDLYKLPAAMMFTICAPLPTFIGISDPRDAGIAIYGVLNIPLILIVPYILLGAYLIGKYKLNIAETIMLRLFPIAILAGISIFYLGILRYNAQLLMAFAIFAAVAMTHRKKYKMQLQILYIGYISALVTVVIIAISR